MVKSDAETPDRWAELRRAREILTAARFEGGENTPFTADEQAELLKELREIKSYMLATYVHSIQAAFVEARFDELEEAVSHLGRMTWRLMFLGGVFGLFLTGVIPPDAVHAIVVTVLQNIGHLFGGSGGGPRQLPLTI